MIVHVPVLRRKGNDEIKTHPKLAKILAFCTAKEAVGFLFAFIYFRICTLSKFHMLIRRRTKRLQRTTLKKEMKNHRIESMPQRGPLATRLIKNNKLKFFSTSLARFP